MNILRELRTKKGVYQKDVAKYLGVDRTTYVKYERGDSEPSIDIIKKLANYFDVTVDFLVGEEKKANTLDEQLSGIEFALYGEIHDLTDDEKQDILSYVKFKNTTTRIILNACFDLPNCNTKEYIKKGEMH